MGHIYTENRRRGDGSISIRHVAEWRDRAGKRAAKRFEKKSEAKQFLAQIDSDPSSPHRLGGRKVNLADLSALYIKSLVERCERGERCTKGHLLMVRGHIDNHILNPRYGLATVKLTDLTAGTIHNFISEMRKPRGRKAGVSVAMARKILTTLRSMLAFALERDLIASNPAKGVRVRGTRQDDHKQLTIPTSEEVRRLIESAPDDFRLFILVAASTGLRSSEQRALKWRDINFRRNELIVIRAVDRFGHFAPPKSRAGHRKVPLSASLVTELKRHRLQSSFSDDEDLVFSNRAGGPLAHGNMLSRRWQPLCKAVGIKTNWHSLRHYYASSLIMANVPLVRVSKYLGHSSIAVTANTYGHLLSCDGDRDAIESLSELLC